MAGEDRENRSLGKALNEKIYGYDSITEYSGNLWRCSIAFMMWLHHLGRDKNLCDSPIFQRIKDLAEFMRQMSQYLERLTLDLVRQPLITEKDLRRLEGIEQVRKAAFRYSESLVWPEMSVETSVTVQEVNSLFESSAQFFLSLNNFHQGLTIAKVDSELFKEKVEGIRQQISEIRDYLRKDLQHLELEEMSEERIYNNLHNTILLCEQAEVYGQVLDYILLRNSQVFSKPFNIDFDKDFRDLDVVFVDEIDLYDPSYNNFC